MERTENQKCALTFSDLRAEQLPAGSDCPYCRESGKMCKVFLHGATPEIAAAKQSVWNPPAAPLPTSFRLGHCVYVLGANTPTGIRFVGTAWVVHSGSGCFLLTASHCLVGLEDSLGSLFIADSYTNNEDGSSTIFPNPPIQVQAIDGNSQADVAVLRAPTPFSSSIPLCPRDHYPSARNEDQVKTYHCPITMFYDGQIDSLAVMATSYDKLQLQTGHHFYVSGQHVRGSSGGVVVDRLGRAVGLICSGYQPGVRLPIPDSINTLWETVTAVSEGTGTFTKCVQLKALPDLETFLRNH